MWHLKSIHAKNLCSFLELDYSPKQGAATLIFGNNLDSDSQNSNGSGKSALIEAIAIGLTGEPLRKVNADEIINDMKDEAIINIILTNDVLGERMTINRRLSRKQPQQIHIIKQFGPYDTETEDIIQATVADYNKYILDQIGLLKEDIFGNFILTARKYKSFLASSDKEKKEIINRFSNGIMVDQSIEELHADMEPIEAEMKEAEKEVATCTGRVEALGTEIEKAINESVERRATNETRIKNWENLIAQKRSDIRIANGNIEKIDESLGSLDELDVEMQKLEKGDKDVNETLNIIIERFNANDLALTTDYAHEMIVLNTQLDSVSQNAKEVADKVKELHESLEKAEDEYTQICATLKLKLEKNEANRTECAERLEKLAKAVTRLQNKADSLNNDERAKKREAASLENQLAGVIQCPKCKHEFTLNAQLDIEAARKSLQSVKNAIIQIGDDIISNNKEYSKTVSDGRNQREIETSLENERRQIAQDSDNAEKIIKEARQTYTQYEEKVEEVNSKLSLIQDKLSKIRKRIFDEVFEIIDSAYKRRENQIKSLEEDINTMKGSIASYEKAIEDAKNASEEDMLASLRKSQAEYQKALQEAVEAKNEVEGRLNELKAQELYFIEFKTYLANTKINAISQITNEFLETIGSDIRVALSGYTILKSGKVRDKISVSLLRDGVDCGSFEKFSAGERVRVELASILSMNQLTNLNCEDGKGLDLLIADEVLDSADEQGLASVFKALNQTQITSLVVSHGQVYEGYPNKITVTKSNGVSSIYETTNDNN
nr:MAG: AAA domain protein [Bacteriophage sp.]